MKKIRHSIYGLAVMLLVSCNLFIDDEFDDYSREVPVHTGVGYDEPISIHENGCDMTYQLNSDVRKVEKEEQDEYVLRMENSDTNGVILIYYSLSTPQELLPVPGEIVLSAATEKLPMGCNHRVLDRITKGDCYVFLLTACTLDETYKDLRIDGSFTKGDAGMIYEEENPFEPAEEGEVIGEARQTRAEDVEFGSTKVKETKVPAFEFISGGSMGFYIPINISKSQKIGEISENAPITNSVSFKLQWNVIWDYSFQNFNLKEGRLWMKEVCRKEQMWELTLSGKMGFSKDLVKRRAIPKLNGHVVTIGYLVLVFFGEYEISVDLTFSADVTLSSTTITEQTVLHDFRDEKNGNRPTAQDLGTKVIKDDPVNFLITIQADFSLTIKIHLCIGLYGKIISIRFIPTFKVLHLNATVPVISNTMFAGAYFTPGKEGITFSPLEFSIEVGVFLDLNLTNLIDAFRLDKSGVKKGALEEYVDEINKEVSYYESHKGEYEPGKDYVPDKKNTLVHDESDLKGLSITLGPWMPLGSYKWSWFPTIKEGTFKLTPNYRDDSSELGTMSYEADYYVEQTGLFNPLMDFEPALAVKQEGMKPEIIYTWDHKKIGDGGYFYFTIPNLKYGKEYTAYPVFFKAGGTTPMSYDEGKKFTPIRNEIFCSDYGVDHAEQYYNDDGSIKNCIRLLIRMNVAGEQNYDTWYLGFGYRTTVAGSTLTRKHIYSEDIHENFKPKTSEGYRIYTIEVPFWWTTYDGILDHQEWSDYASVEAHFWLNWRMKGETEEHTRPLIGFVLLPGHHVWIYKGAVDEEANGYLYPDAMLEDDVQAPAEVYF